MQCNFDCEYINLAFLLQSLFFWDKSEIFVSQLTGTYNPNIISLLFKSNPW